MAYRSETEAWVRRAESAEARAKRAEEELQSVSQMNARSPWLLLIGAVLLACAGVGAGWAFAPQPERPGFVAALQPQAAALQQLSAFSWAATAKPGGDLAAAGEVCSLSLQASDFDGDLSPRQGVDVRLECDGRLLFGDGELHTGERRIGGCSVHSGDSPGIFCTYGGRMWNRHRSFFVNTRARIARLTENGETTEFELSSPMQDPGPGPTLRRPDVIRSELDVEGEVVEVTGVPRSANLVRARMRVGATCRVRVRSFMDERCSADIECAGEHYSGEGACEVDENGQIQRFVDLVPSLWNINQRGDGNAMVLYDVRERRLELTESEGYGAFALSIALNADRTLVRYR